MSRISITFDQLRQRHRKALIPFITAGDPEPAVMVPLMRELVKDYSIVIVTHNMQQAARVSDYTAFMLTDEKVSGQLIEYGATQELFTNPRDKRTEDYISGRFG